MIFVMDESGSIRAENFELMKQFAINVTDRFEIGPNHAQVGWINFNGMARVVFNLNTYEDKASLHDAIRAVTYSGGGTDIGAGLLALHDYGFLESAGARNTFDIPEVAIVVTDGQSDLGPIESAAQLLRDNRNVNVFVVGVGSGVRIEQLNAVASAGIATDNINHVYQLSGFQEFDVIEETIRARTCFDAMFADHETSIERLNMTERTIQMTTIHINLECPPDGLTINACGREGKTFLYISTNPSPNSARYHKIIEVSAGECKNAFIDCSGCDNGSGRRRRQAVGTDSGEKIYITIEGVEEENIYELGAEKGDHSTPQVNLHCVKKVTDDRAGVVVSCTSDRELTDIKCSIINCSPAAPCTLPWTVNFTPPIRDYHLQINVTDSLNLTDSVTVVHQVGPLGLVCSLNTELKVECSSSNQLAPNDTVCTFNGVTEDPCILPHEIDVKGLPVGTHTIHVIATDVFEQTAETTVDYIVVEDRVGDDMVFSTVLDIRPIEVGVSEPTVSLCYQVHGQEGHFYNLISDYCVSVNAHISQPKTEVDSHVIDKIGIRAIGSNGTCYSIAIIRENCAISINGTLLPINSKFEEESVVVRNVRRITRKPNVVHISVPNCGRPLVDTMHITCTEYHIRHSAIPTEVLEFTTTRGLSPIDAAHGLLGQFWGRFMLGQPLSPVQGQNDKEMTIFHQPRLKRFNGFVHRSWSSRGEMCFYAGDRQGGPVILGQYEDYEVETLLSTEYIFSKFEGETFDP